MDLTTESRQHVETVASDVLQQFTNIAEAAEQKLRGERASSAGALASVNTMTSGQAIQKLDQISSAVRQSYETLVTEPAISRVVVTDEQGAKRTYYICRTTPLSGFPTLASYRSPVGRLAELEVGTEFTLPNGNRVEVLERARLRPTSSADGWDSRNTIFEADDIGPITIESLRALLGLTAGKEVTKDLLGQLLAEESQKANIIEGVRRSVITKMGLRDQPVLDQYQGEIFRLPLDQRLLILGPPGTGKTTTLIRRLGQKRDTEYLDEDEKQLVQVAASAANGQTHADSWLMFTPTELLKQYLKEAFARESVPASDLHIRTWNEYRRELARNSFGVLRTASGGGVFVLKETSKSLGAVAEARPVEWYSDFNAWQRTAYLADLRDAAQALCEAKSTDIQGLGQRLRNIVAGTNDKEIASVFSALAAETTNIQTLVTHLKEASDAKIHASLNLSLNRDRGFLDALAKHLDELQQTAAQDSEEQDELDVDEEEELSTPRTGRAEAVRVYTQAVRAQARATASKRTLSKNSRSGKIIDWLGERTLSEGDRNEVGANLLILSSARKFAHPLKRYLDGISRRYRSFRRQRQEEDTWYAKEGFEPRDIHPLELDVVLLAILQAATDLVSRPMVMRSIDEPIWSALKPYVGLYRNQILVDEATDFSPIQLACMAALAHPRVRSFFACGDFNQRLTTWGTRSPADMQWVSKDIDIREITVSYRQTRQLNELSRALIRAAGGKDQTATLPPHVDSEGVAPVLLEGASNFSVVVSWLAERIREIERFVRQLPSTAIFVNTEVEVAPLAAALNAALAEHNIQVVACPQGQVMGQDNDVRVFDIQHIKGLEFEAVFFVGVDRLADQHPELFDKYLYVGTTRAATYLGVTCDGLLPKGIATLRSHFAPDWQSPMPAEAHP